MHSQGAVALKVCTRKFLHAPSQYIAIINRSKNVHTPGAHLRKSYTRPWKCARRVQGAPLISDTGKGGGDAKSFHSLKGVGGAQKVLPCLGGGGGVSQKVSDPQFSYFVAPPLPIINDQSLRSEYDGRSPLPLRSEYKVAKGIPPRVHTVCSPETEWRGKCCWSSW